MSNRTCPNCGETCYGYPPMCIGERCGEEACGDCRAKAETCQDCGTDTTDLNCDLRGDQWAAIHPEGEGGMLCPNCMVRRSRGKFILALMVFTTSEDYEGNDGPVFPYALPVPPETQLTQEGTRALIEMISRPGRFIPNLAEALKRTR